MPQIVDTERLERRIFSHQTPRNLIHIRGEVPIRPAIRIQKWRDSSIQHNACISAWCPPIQRAWPIGLGADEADLLAAAINI
jgi:hypothetical protein